VTGDALSEESRATVEALGNYLARTDPPLNFSAHTRHEYTAAIDELRRVAGGGVVDQRRLLYLVMGTAAGGRQWPEVFEVVPREALSAVVDELMTVSNDLSEETRTTLDAMAGCLLAAAEEMPDFSMLTGHPPEAAIEALRRGAAAERVNVGSLLHIVGGLVAGPGVSETLLAIVPSEALDAAHHELSIKRTPLLRAAFSGPIAAQAKEDLVGFKIWTSGGLTTTGKDP
jgi:hypothetical protein